MHDVMRFWLAGVDGFRVDVIWHLIKDDQFRDNPPNPHFRDGRPPHSGSAELHRRSARGPDIIAGMRSVLDEFPSA